LVAQFGAEGRVTRRATSEYIDALKSSLRKRFA